ncbi:MAG: phosphonate C-P lyase system protein PhnG [Pseudomonadota bacterium]
MTTQSERKEWMSVLAKAPDDLIDAAFGQIGAVPPFTWLRKPEIGAVMVRGRAGATGGPFNLGEMTVTRCSLSLDDGTVGHAYVPGRNRDKARVAALCDALLQGPGADAVQRTVIAPLRAHAEAEKRQAAGRAEQTKVDFFTMVRGEN